VGVQVITADDMQRMTDSVYIEGPVRSRQSSRFWVLLVLSAVIATAGVGADSVATVIGAMIVAPLMTPILGAALALVLADRGHLIRSFGLIVGGALAVVAIAFAISAVMSPMDAYAGNEQVASRISPSLIDLLAALATGTVGAFVIVRSDISDALPGVAIAISLVPPLAVTGMLLQVGRYGDAAESGLLFATNVTAILATGTAVLLGYRVRAAARDCGYGVGRLTGRTLAAVVIALVMVSVPLSFGSFAAARDQQLEAAAKPLAETWATDNGWGVASVTVTGGVLAVTILGEPPVPDPSDLRQALNENGYSDSALAVAFVGGGVTTCPAQAPACISRTTESAQAATVGR
jgi:uncharacterized hydrophobic protein (TIGR00271 family)